MGNPRHCRESNRGTAVSARGLLIYFHVLNVKKLTFQAHFCGQYVYFFKSVGVFSAIVFEIPKLIAMSDWNCLVALIEILLVDSLNVFKNNNNFFKKKSTGLVTCC